ncbi:aspartyl/asparaginyl beta-hydroxylase domain-containing protein [Pseudonocardia sp. HH130629-09]|uniref:aspartyl/asparaginyl beta-hydroxylase domain-containing protein n=1 Tax=Pseudonocardia sp. HH130629-09 TaxID=1641402 RepID=UPI001EE72112|nr:aspartyl/asparaginyl beta-hydroxylase domain-containing protein [Pseudonocardia sp. HH130629-09]
MPAEAARLLGGFAVDGVMDGLVMDQLGVVPQGSRNPRLGAVLDAIPAPVHDVRILTVSPGSSGVECRETARGPRSGIARMHMPIATDPGAVLDLDGIPHSWQPGELWFGDFGRLHRFRNRGTRHLVHLVIDALVVPELTGLFPPEWRPYFDGGDVLVNRRGALGGVGCSRPGDHGAEAPLGRLECQPVIGRPGSEVEGSKADGPGRALPAGPVSLSWSELSHRCADAS